MHRINSSGGGRPGWHRQRLHRDTVSSAAMPRRLVAAMLTLNAMLAALVVSGVALPWLLSASGHAWQCPSLGMSPEAQGEAVIATGIAMNIPEQGIVIGLAAAMSEPGMHTLTSARLADSLALSDGRAAGHQAVGVSGHNSSGWAASRELMSPTVAAAKFFTAMRAAGGWEARPDAYAAHVPTAKWFYLAHIDEVHAARCWALQGQLAADLVGVHS